MKKCLILVVAVVFFASWAEAGGDPQATAKAFGAGKPVVVRENIKTLTATVVAIDHAKRLVSLKGPKGNVVELKAGDDVPEAGTMRRGLDTLAHMAFGWVLK
jgi:high-affinity K+ transport system ATPase subunit B